MRGRLNDYTDRTTFGVEIHEQKLTEARWTMEQEAKIFKYQTPEFEGVKKSMIVCNSDLMKVMVQVVKNDGENNVHSNTGDDALWYEFIVDVYKYNEAESLTDVGI